MAKHVCSPISLVAVTFVVCACMGSVSTPDQSLTHVGIETRGAPTIADHLTLAGFDVLQGSIAEEWFELIVSDAELKVLLDKGLKPKIIAVGRPFRQVQSERPGVLTVPSGYPELTQIIAQMSAVESDYPSICKFVDLTEAYGTPATFEGRHMFAVKISDNAAEDEDEPAFLMVGAHHAREVVTPVIALYAIEQFTQQYGLNQAITALVDEHEIWIAPVWNPDGYEFVFETDNLWRKNRRIFADGVGVDLNRNYPFGWDAPCGGSAIITSQTYRGPAATSEPETQTMIAFGQDQHFAKVTDLHSHAREVRYGNGCLPHPFMDYMASEAADLAAVAGYQTRRSCCTGGDIHFHVAYHGSHAFLWETHRSFQPDFASARIEAARVFPSVLALLQRPSGVTGHVTNAFTGDAVAATISYLDVVFENGETNGSDQRWGRYHAFMPPGTYTLEFAAKGYFPQCSTVNVVSGLGQVVDVPMIPLAADLNGDGCVDMADFAAFAACWHQYGVCEGTNLVADGNVGFDELKKLTYNWLAKPAPRELTTLTAGGEGIISPAGGLFQHGTVLTLTATPYPGYRVKSWRGTDSDQSTAGTNVVTMDSDKAVRVEFEATP
jgi:hypothetical protein